MLNSEYESLTDLAKRYDTTSHQLGRWLAALGLRVVGGKPTQKAWELGLVKAAPTNRGEGDHLFYLWHVEKTMALLAGHHHAQADQQHDAVETNLLVGPFSHRLSGTSGCEILNGNGEVFCWITGEKAAKYIVKVLNLLDKYNKLPPPEN